MFLPKLNIPKVEKAGIFLPLPEWKYAEKFFKLEKKTRFLNIQIKYSEKFLIAGPLIGAPVVPLLLKILKDTGVKEVFVLGWAGTFQPELLGEVFLPEKALSKEGTSKFFSKKRVFAPDPELFVKLMNCLKSKNIKFYQGKVLSTDVSLCFFPEKIKSLPDNVLAIDMETSAFFSVGKYLQMKVVVLHFIIDAVGSWLSVRPEDKLREKREKVLLVMKELLSS
ncbi:MAG: nucleoside phosphorylase [Thermodesulfobacteria bacterium]|nr:nucleoside phosphorylase [Thermodesulfobacteriota bacterium]